MTKIEPLKSMRQQSAEASQQRDGSKRQLDVAQRCMEKAIERDMDPALIRRALDMYSKIMDESPDLPQPYLAIAYLSWKSGAPETALRFLEDLLLVHPMSVHGNALVQEIQSELS